MNGDESHDNTRKSAMDLESIRRKWKPAFDRICDSFDAPMEHHCNVLTQQLIHFNEDKAAILSDVFKTVGEQQAHRAFDDMLRELIPLSLRRLILLIGIDSTPVPEQTIVALPQPLPSPTLSAKYVTNTGAESWAKKPSAVACSEGKVLMPFGFEIDAQATTVTVQQSQRLMSSYFTFRSSSTYRVPSTGATTDVHIFMFVHTSRASSLSF
ncbi:uncharacterized protein SPSK_07992 [Sporothrix schenckii 1099-18]|uniref:Uncharacterized protein n=1 Tax=Sporothrix schenckii 1099-18 TaxID=1397361 RepID=A0A0F2MFL9_SPOSC|nr:uncharacterized protein SPSK_07992 [Sporothrix schenckii 1099-18]KJR87645.1 hypothetical protein SPSK_07992 [Sporothrix schenckii 1099-18]